MMKRLILVSFAALIICACYAQENGKYTKDLTRNEFMKKVADPDSKDWKFMGDKPAIVDFWAIWCPPCKELGPILEDLAKEYEGIIDIYKVDTDSNKSVSRAYGISSIPTMLFIPADGREPQRVIGLKNKEFIKDLIENFLLKK